MNNNRVLILVCVVLAAIFVGVTIVAGKADWPVAKRMILQQERTLSLLQGIQRQLDRLTTYQSANEKLAALTARQQGLEKRIQLLETRLNQVPVAGLAQAGQKAPQPPLPSPQRPQFPPDEYTKIHEIPIGHSYIKGKKDAPITIVEFSDLQCPFCARFHPVLDEVVKAFPNDVKVVLKNFPLSFHQQARPAAKAALAAGEQEKYYEMVGAIMKRQKDLGKEGIYEELAEDIGLNVKKFNQDLKKNDAKYEKILDADMELGRKVEVRGTPTFYINGRKTTARDLNSYKAEIQKELKELKKKN